jgi:hypothetical protein
MSGRLRSPLWVGALVLGWLAPASADVRAEDIRISYAAPEGCGSADEFFAQLASRATVTRVDTAAARSFDITIAPAPDGGVHGTLAIRSTAGESVREVDGASCAETIAALVVVASLAVSAEREAAPPIVEPPPPAIVAAPPPVRVHERWLAVGSGLARYSGVLPEPVFGVPVFVTVGRVGGPQLRLAFARTATQEAMLTAGTSEFRQTIGRLDARPGALTRGAFELAPSIGIEAGALTAHGTQVGSPAGGTRPWVAPDVAARASVHAGRFALELEGLLAIPLVRDRYFIAPGITVHQVPVVTFGVGLALIVEVL